MARRFVVAGMLHETNTFSPVATPLDAFFSRAAVADRADGPMLGGQRAIDAYAGTNIAFAAFLEAARTAGAQVDVPVYANASPSAPTDRRSFDTMADAIVAAVARGCDAVMLDLHGAMVAEGFDDGEAELLRRIREVAPEVPIAVALDFHGNLSPDLVSRADVLTGYRTYPHVDMGETGERAARSLLAGLDGKARPFTVHRWLPMLTHMNQHSPMFQPMKDIMARAIRMEADGEVMNASVFGGFPLADIPWAGLSVVVVGDAAKPGGREAAQACCDELAAMAWERREEFVYRPDPLEKTIAEAARLADWPVVIADHGNNTASGGSADTMETIAEALRQGLQGIVAGPVRDTATVAAMIEAGVGARVTLPVGGRVDMPTIGRKGKPLTLTGTVRAITDGQFTVTGPMMTGVRVSCGRTAVLDTGPLQLVVSEERVEPMDLGVFTHCGVDPLRARYVIVFSRQHFRAGFQPIAKTILMAAGPGVCSSDYSQFPFRRLRRPMYPLDPHATLEPVARGG
ncbi:MAG: M81 family metallopeptidase [Burkholderiaceae bacterium]|nr:M81 family metallopeptidase [Burkholderiaceae bacterium]